MARADLDDDDLDDDFRAELAQLRERRERAEQSLRDAFARSPAVLVRGSHPRQELWILSQETDPTQGKLRVTEFLPDGPYGHISRENLDEIIDEKASPAHVYEPVDDAFVMRWTSTEEWNEGIKKVAYVQAYNQLMWVASRHSAHEYAWQVHLRAQALDNWEDATRLLEQAASDIEGGRIPNEGRALRVPSRATVVRPKRGVDPKFERIRMDGETFLLVTQFLRGMEITLRKDTKRAMHAPQERDIVGVLITAPTSADELEKPCPEALARLEHRVGRPLDLQIVTTARLATPYQGRGFGRFLYLEAARLAAEHGAALIRHDCQFVGYTSPQAMHVWKSRILRDDLLIEDERIAVLPSSLPKRNPTALKRSLLEART